MIQVHSFTFNPFQENTYLLTNEHKEAIVIDPGMYDAQEVNLLTEFIRSNELKLTKVLLTHAHLDHIFGLKALLEIYDVPFYLHEAELPVYENAEAVAKGYGVELTLPQKEYQLISENETVTFGEEELEIRFTPGHSPGSICFYYKGRNTATGGTGWVIGGDVLFQQSIGRTDLPGGDFDTLIKSIQTQIFTLPDETIVYSGHGPSTVVGLEKMNNPFFR